MASSTKLRFVTLLALSAGVAGCGSAAVSESDDTDQGELGELPSVTALELGNYYAPDDSSARVMFLRGRVTIAARLALRGPDQRRLYVGEPIGTATIDPSKAAADVAFADNEKRCSISIARVDERTFTARGTCPTADGTRAIETTLRRVAPEQMRGLFLARDPMRDVVWALSVIKADDDDLDFSIDVGGRPYWASTTGKGRWTPTADAYEWDTGVCKLALQPSDMFRAIAIRGQSGQCGLDPPGLHLTRDR